jgi:hypothetical protein
MMGINYHQVQNAA